MNILGKHYNKLKDFHFYPLILQLYGITEEKYCFLFLRMMIKLKMIMNNS